MRPRLTAGANPLVELKKPQLAHVKERQAAERQISKELAYLVGSEGWLYAQRVANQIQKEFDCKPTDPGWQTLTTIQYAFNQLFGRVKKRIEETAEPILGQSILAEIAEQNADNSRGIDGRGSGTSDGGRARIGAQYSRRRRGAE